MKDPSCKRMPVMTTMMEFISTQNADPYLDTDDRWRQTVLDHIDLLKQKATVKTISLDDLVQCTYNPRLYLRKLKVRDSLYWIIMLMNEWRTDADFHLDMPYRVMYIPTEDSLSKLYSDFNASYV